MKTPPPDYIHIYSGRIQPGDLMKETDGTWKPAPDNVIGYNTKPYGGVYRPPYHIADAGKIIDYHSE
jgi:hypothetical protein